MASLAALDLAVNRLSGPIPPTLATLPMLKVLGPPGPHFSSTQYLPTHDSSAAHQDLTTILNPISSFARLIFPPSCLCSPYSTSLAPSFPLQSPPSARPTMPLASSTLSVPFHTPIATPSVSSLPVDTRTPGADHPNPHLLPGPSCPHSPSSISPPTPSPTHPPHSPTPFLFHSPLSSPSSCYPSLLSLIYSRVSLPAPSLCFLLPLIPYPIGIGPIPAFCQEGQILSFLNLTSNSLSGPPTPLSSPSCSDSLQFLSLPANSLSGPIPATISSFTNLKRLRLHKNNLTGAIPAGVSKMNQLQGLGLSYNRLSGEIPPDWSAGIRQVLLAGNGLSGAVPAALSRLKRGSFKPGNPNLCGKPLLACA
ncbi:unnamed protein product [Closterium sp. NIES-64]|nr:unnamed protein product [Closterium sp. NIES-64]